MSFRLLIRQFSTSSKLKELNKAFEFEKVVSTFESSSFESENERIKSQEQYFSALKQMHYQRSPHSKALADLWTLKPIHSSTFISSSENKELKSIRRKPFLTVLALLSLGYLIIKRYFGISIVSFSSGFIKATKPNVKFEDVLGIDECRQELIELVNFLKNPEKYQKIGAKLPKGLLLTGKPGTGKTLMAKAVAGEANANFYHCSGSDFEEMYAGLGSKRIRELFTLAKMTAPCILFIDEIDCLASQRNLNYGESSRQTLNQLLVEMDGFSINDSVIVIAATNFPESLDKALLRSGRFDKVISLPPPDMKGRKELFELYVKKVKMLESVDFLTLSRMTTGLTGADISNIVNIAALRAAGEERTGCIMQDFEFAIDRVTIGIENRSYTFPKKDLRDVAIHEVGHALAAYYTKGAGTLHKITILPRGPSLGHAKILENKDKTEKSLLEIMGTVDTMMGGRAAEFVVKGQDFVTLGCSSDLNYATNFVYAGIERGMFRDKLGVYVPKNFNEVSEQMRNQIDSVAMEILQESFKRVVGILQSKKKIIEAIADELLEVETMSANQVVSLIKSLE